VAARLVSPITWVHHLVWLLPALWLLFDRGLAMRRWRLVSLAVGLYVLLCSRLVWQLTGTGWASLPGSAYLYAAVVLLFALPLQSPGPALAAPVHSGRSLVPESVPVG
jgi:alpha-1,2-mannosyltransferase